MFSPRHITQSRVAQHGTLDSVAQHQDLQLLFPLYESALSRKLYALFFYTFEGGERKKKNTRIPKSNKLVLNNCCFFGNKEVCHVLGFFLVFF